MFELKPIADPATLGRPLELSVVIPTLNEIGNVEPLLERLGLALAGIEWEAMFVDDGSTDGTAELVTRLAQTERRIRLIRRIGRRGLSSAVIEGALASTSPVIAVIDADLQHDETILPELYRAIDTTSWRSARVIAAVARPATGTRADARSAASPRASPRRS